MNETVIDNFLNVLSDVEDKLVDSSNEQMQAGNYCASCWASGAIPEEEESKLLAAMYGACKESPETARYMLIREMTEYRSQALLYESLLEKLDDLFEPETTAEEMN